MRKVLFLCGILGMLCFSGCQKDTVVWETVSDQIYLSVDGKVPVQLTMDFTAPEDAVQSADAFSEGTVYQQAEGKYEIIQETMQSTAESAIKLMTGFSKNELTVMETKAFDMARYDFVWSAASEQGQQVCRGVVFDDGTYCYTLTFQTAEENGGELQECMDEMFASIGFHEDEGF